MWVITSFFGLLIYILSGTYKYFSGNIDLHFTSASIPLLAVRVVLEILQSYFTVLAIQKADRSTFSILRILTIPLLIISDIVMGYHLTTGSLVGMCIIFMSFFWFNFQKNTLNFTAWKYVLFTAINAVFTITLYKYSLTHYGNSVEIDQGIMLLGSFVFFLIYNYTHHKSCALRLIWQEKHFMILGITIGISSLILSYSYVYLNSSEATMIKRAGEMFWSILSGYVFFWESHFNRKFILAICIIVGLFIMIL